MANNTKTSIQPILEADVPAHGQLLRDAKLELTINRLLFKDWPNDEAQRPVYEGAVRGGFNDPATESWKVVDDETGAMVGYLSLTRKTPSKDAGSAKPGNVPPPTPEGMNEDVFRTVIALIPTLQTLHDVEHFGEVPRDFQCTQEQDAEEMHCRTHTHLREARISPERDRIPIGPHRC